MPLLDDLWGLSVIVAPKFVKFDPWAWHKKTRDNVCHVFSSFSRNGLREHVCPFEVLK